MATKPTAAGLIFGLVLASAGVAIAQSASPDAAAVRALCLDTSGSETDVVIDNCSRWIATGALTPAELEQAYDARGYAYVRSENFDEAVADLTRRMNLLPPDAALFRQRADLQGFDGAIADLREAIRLAPDDPKNYLARARRFHRQAFTRDEGGGWGWNADGAWVMKGVWDEAYVAAALNDYAETIRIASENGEAYPVNRDAYGWRAELFDAMGDRARAIPDYTRAMELGGGNRDRRAQAHLRLGNFAEAMADLEVLMRLGYRTSGLFAMRGDAHAGLGEHALAIQDLDEALRIIQRGDEARQQHPNPDMRRSLNFFGRDQHIAVLTSRARSYHALGRIAAAEADLEQARLLTGP